MSYFLAPEPLRAGQTLTLEGEEAGHLLKSRRLRAGDSFALQGPDGLRFAAEVVEVRRHAAVVRMLAPLAVPPMPRIRLTLLLAAVKEKALEFALQKTTELGAAEIAVFRGAYSPVSEAELLAPRTLARWERIVREACKQSDRQFPPRLHAAAHLAAALEHARDADVRMVLHPGSADGVGSRLSIRPGPQSAAALVGPEAGLAGEEVALAQAAGYHPVGLGSLILRADTAAVAITTLVTLS